MRISPRYTVRTDASGVVRLSSADAVVLAALGEDDAGRVIRAYWVPDNDGRGGYVRQITDWRFGTLGPQVCERLDLVGATLYATPSTLASRIRRELRRCIRRYEAEVKY